MDVSLSMGLSAMGAAAGEVQPANNATPAVEPAESFIKSRLLMVMK
jgi:hypothetical protein